MKPIATITTTKTKRFEFHKPELFHFLKDVVGFRYTTIDGQGYYLQQNIDGTFEIVNLLDIRRAFLNLIETNLEQIPLDGECTYEELYNAFVEKSPVKNGNFSREFLAEGFTLDSHNLHLIRLKINVEYRKKHTNAEMLKFLENEDFTETIDQTGNFASNKPLFYKRRDENTFMVINRPFIDDKNNDTNFDLWKVQAKNESEFLKKEMTDNRKIDIRLGFNLERDLLVYTELLNGNDDE